MNLALVWPYLLATIVAAALEVYANIQLAKSDGFKKRKQALFAFIFVALAFSCLAFAVRGIGLAVGYALWGAFGILGTSIGGWLLFGQRLRPSAWAGLVLLMAGIALLQFA